MKPSVRKIKKWRKSSPMAHRSFAEKRGRQEKHLKDEIKSYKEANNDSKWAI